MNTRIFKHAVDAGHAAAVTGAAAIKTAIAARGRASIVLAAAASQIEMLRALAATPDIGWHRVTAFNLDEYVGLPSNHPACFRTFLTERFVTKLPQPLAAVHFIDAQGDWLANCAPISDSLAQEPIDVAFIGIGENGHLAFNDPPADFTTVEAFLIVELDEASRRQQLGEGWFASLADVPTHAITMSIPQILTSRVIVCTAPDRRKAVAVRDTLQGAETPECPASILRRHAACHLFLDRESATLLDAVPVVET